MTSRSVTAAALDARARRTALSMGYRAEKSRTAHSIDNHGGYRLVDDSANVVVAGERYQLSATEVVAMCSGQR